MNWKIIFQLSVFGLIMAFATLSLIPQKYEWPFWLVIFIFCSYVIAKVCTGKYFGHGFLVGLVNCFWITVVHFCFYSTYFTAHKADIDKMNVGMPPAMLIHPRLVMSVGGLVLGVASALLLGLFAFIASKIVKKPAA